MVESSYCSCKGRGSSSQHTVSNSGFIGLNALFWLSRALHIRDVTKRSMLYKNTEEKRVDLVVLLNQSIQQVFVQHLYVPDYKLHEGRAKNTSLTHVSQAPPGSLAHLAFT